MSPAIQILWAGPAILAAAIIVGWGAEISQLYLGQGLALAVLAWIQTAPELAVEAVIAWHRQQSLMLANLTGSLRLLLGLGWPLVYFAAAFSRHNRGKKWPIIQLKWFNGLEVTILLISTVYFTFIWFKGSLAWGDSIFLSVIYIVYLVQLMKVPQGLKESEEDLPLIGKAIARLKSPFWRWSAIICIFAFGAGLLKMATHPFLLSLEALAATAGISSFFFIQWVAPFASEFPEKVTAFRWARKDYVPMALVNMISSNIVQWTLGAAILAPILSLSKHLPTAVIFDSQQEREIILTVAQSFLGIAYLMDLEVRLHDALILLIMWGIQFFVPESRVIITILYFVLAFFEIGLLIKAGKFPLALKAYKERRAQN